MPLRSRHWKQRFSDNAKYIWNKNTIWKGDPVAAGDPIPADLASDRNKLRRFWEAGVIQLSGFEAPDVVTGQRADITKWRDMPYWGQVRIARAKGLTGNGFPSKSAVASYLEEHVG